MCAGDLGGSMIATLTGPQGSGMISSVVQADGLMVVPEAVDVLEAGSEVDVIVLAASDNTQMELGFEI